MEQKDIDLYFQRFSKYGLTRLEVKDGDFHLKLEKESLKLSGLDIDRLRQAGGGQFPLAAADKSSGGEGENQGREGQAQTGEGIEVRSPMVGTCYRAASPEAAPFVTIGQKVEKGDVVAIIEAMKMMNEILAPASGIVGAIEVADGDMVEYDQVLIRIFD